MDLEKHPAPDPQTPPAPVPGWYADPEFAGSERYWDGSMWSGQRRPTEHAAGGPHVTPPPVNGFAIAGLTCGIVGLALAILPITFYVAWVLGIPSIVFGVIGRNRAGQTPEMGRKGMATAALILGVLTLIVVIAWTLLALFFISQFETGFTDGLEQFDTCVENPSDPICD